jgi:hypothetical protein
MPVTEDLSEEDFFVLHVEELPRPSDLTPPSNPPCWHVLRERVCLSLMARTKGGAEGSISSGGGANNKQRSQLRKESAIHKRLEIKYHKIWHDKTQIKSRPSDMQARSTTGMNCGRES